MGDWWPRFLRSATPPLFDAALRHASGWQDALGGRSVGHMGV